MCYMCVVRAIENENGRRVGFAMCEMLITCEFAIGCDVRKCVNESGY